jgi:hypothetical protein
VTDSVGRTISNEKGTIETSLLFVVWTPAGWRMQKVTSA